MPTPDSDKESIKESDAFGGERSRYVLVIQYDRKNRIIPFNEGNLPLFDIRFKF